MAVNSSFRVIPKNQEQLLRNNENSNFSLYFPRMVSWEFKHGDGEFQLYSGEEKIVEKGKTQWKKQNDDAKEELCNAGNVRLKNVNALLSKKHELQTSYLESLKKSGIQTFTFAAKTSSPFVTGLGSGHPTETGMVLDRNLGVPYLPASSIKGVLRLAYAVNISNGRSEVPDAELEEYFGSADTNNGKRGQLIFLDAYPRGNVGLKVDIMNPHFGKYYSGENKQPAETESPVPIKFLTVKEGTEFVFSCAYLPLGEKNRADEKVKDDVEKMFKTAFTKVGFGGKTSIGYGRFRTVDENAKPNATQAKQTQELSAGEYEAVITELDKNRASIYFEIKKQKCVLRNCKPKDFQIFHKKDKVKITLDGTKDKNGFYVVKKVEKINP